MLQRFKSLFRRYRRDEDASIVVESALMLPTLFCACLATYVFFDAFRAQSINLKAAYTLSDMVSRRGLDENGYVTNTYLTSLWRMHRFITNTNDRTKMRVTVITYVEDDDDYRVCWSEQRGGAGRLGQAGLDSLVADNKIPVLPDGERLIVMQTWVTHEPIFSIGRDWAMTFEDLVVTSPRFTAQLKFSSTGYASDEQDCF